MDSGGLLVDPLSNSRRDSACKIVGLGDHGFFLLAGILGVEEFRGIAAAKDAFQKSKPEDWHQVAVTWQQATTNTLNSFIKRHPEAVVNILGHPTDAVFGFTDGIGRITAYDIHLTIVMVGKQAKVRSSFSEKKPTEDAELIGRKEYISLMSEFAADKTPRARSAQDDLSRIISQRSDRDVEPLYSEALLMAVIKWRGPDPYISAPIDILTLERGGRIKWEKRKPECYKEDAN
jgi:hypothetical protein